MAEGVSQRLAQRLAAWYLPASFSAAVPRVIVDAMRRRRVRMLSRDLPRDAVYDRPAEYLLASASMSIVVAIHDAPKVLARCLASLERDAPAAEVILVDDGSKLPQTAEVIRDFTARNGWQLVRNAAAGGHSAACTSGARLATRAYLCLLNSDTVVTPWCWRAIAEAFEADPAIGVAGPSTSDSGNDQQFDIAKHCRFFWNDSQICAFAQRLLVPPNPALPQQQAAPRRPEITDLPWISGFAFFIRRELWERLGGFAPGLPDYGNEIELCHRVVQQGRRTVWVRNAYIHHLAQQSYVDAIGMDAIIHARIKAEQAYLGARPQEIAQLQSQLSSASRTPRE